MPQRLAAVTTPSEKTTSVMNWNNVGKSQSIEREIEEFLNSPRGFGKSPRESLYEVEDSQLAWWRKDTGEKTIGLAIEDNTFEKAVTEDSSSVEEPQMERKSILGPCAWLVPTGRTTRCLHVI